MKTSKDNIEYQIKKQIEEREIAPSRDLWSEIEVQNSSNNRPKSQMNWVLVAACLILTLSLGTVLFFLNQPSEIQPEIVKKTEENKAGQIIKNEAQDNTVLAAQNNDKEEVKKIPSQDKEEMISAVAIDQSKLIPRETAVKKIEIPQISNPKLLAKADSLKTPVKKKKYVDPSTLLFSVEHKDVIEKTKDGSNVATTIDLNAR
jgi:predicted RND superfamily exporter protein